MIKAELIKKQVLANHKEWLDGMFSNIEDFPNSLDIAESANEADFSDTLFNGLDVSFQEEEAVNIFGITCKYEFNHHGFELYPYCEDGEEEEAWYKELEEEFKIFIPWDEFDEQKNEYK
jgi:hypothetical protein